MSYRRAPRKLVVCEHDVNSITAKQYQLLSAIIEGTVNDEGERSYLDMDQLLVCLSYRTTKASIQFSLRVLERRRMIIRDYEKRRDRRRAIFLPTKIALKVITNQFERPHEEKERVMGLDIEW